MLLGKPERCRAANDRRHRQRAEIAAVEAVGLRGIHQEDLARPERAAARPNGQQTAAMVVRERRSDEGAVDGNAEVLAADSLVRRARQSV